MFYPSYMSYQNQAIRDFWKSPVQILTTIRSAHFGCNGRRPYTLLKMNAGLIYSLCHADVFLLKFKWAQ